MKQSLIFLLLIAGVLPTCFAQVISVTTNPTTLQAGQSFTATVSISGCTSNNNQIFNPVTLTCDKCTVPSITMTGSGTCMSSSVSIGTFNFTVDPSATGSDITFGGSITGTEDCTSPCPIAASAPLPVDLISFDARLYDNKVSLQWKTATEFNNEKFLVERSIDGKQYQTIGQITGAGTSATEKLYFFEDHHPNEGLNYYRLKQVDFDGNFEYSPIKSVRIGNSSQVAVIYPTIVNSFLTIDFIKETKANMKILDYQGKVILIKNGLSDLQTQLDVSTLTKGHYILQLKTINGIVNERFVKM